MQKIGDTHYYVDVSVSPVIELSPSCTRGSEVGMGRLYVHNGYDGRDGWVWKPDAVSDTYEALVRWLRKNVLTKEKHGVGYVSRGAKAHVEGGGTLARF